MIEEKLKEHHRRLFWLNVRFWCAVSIVCALAVLAAVQ